MGGGNRDFQSNDTRYIRDSTNVKIKSSADSNISRKSFSPFGELIPNLSQIALNNLNFSDTNALGGFRQVYGTGWTIAGTIGMMCGIPLRMPIGGNDFKNQSFLANVVCLSDVLATNGYTQVMLMGSDENFAGRGGFLKTHKIANKDINHYKNIGRIDKDYNVNWGFEDSVLFNIAKDELQNLKEPFALYLLTTDTHAPDGFVDKKCDDMPSFGYANAIKCSDRLISDFVSWVANQPFANDTTIIIVGDHLSMKQNFFPKGTHRHVFNVFINPAFPQDSLIYDDNITLHRDFSHFDMFPTILSSLGFRIVGDRLGLGVNLANGKKTLLESIGEKSLNENLAKDSKVYDDFWNIL